MRRFHRAREARLVSRARVATLTSAVALCFVMTPSLAAQQGEPPSDWRPEEQPRDLSALASQEESPERSADAREQSVHEVRRGDTLWHLAGRYLANPFRWPDIHRLNTHVVEDPHWIYPGDRLTLPPDAARVASLGRDAPARRVAEGSSRERSAADGSASPASPRRPMEDGAGVSRFGGSSVFDQSPRSSDRLGTLGIDEASPSPLVSRSDFYRSAFLADPASLGPVATTARKLEGNPLNLSLPAGVKLNDRVVLALDGLAVAPDDVLQALRFGRRVEGHGQIVHSMALLQVVEVQGDSARAVVRRVYGNYRVGDPVVVAERFAGDVPATRHRAAEPLVTRVVGVEREQALLGRGAFLFLDLGEEAGVTLGDEFAIFSPHEADVAEARWEDRQAVARVMRVRPGTATVMIVDLKDVGATSGAPARLAFRAGTGP